MKRSIPVYDSLNDGVVIRAYHSGNTWATRVDGHHEVATCSHKDPSVAVHQARAKVLSYCRKGNSNARGQHRKEPYPAVEKMERILNQPPALSGVEMTDTHPFAWAAWDFEVEQ